MRIRAWPADVQIAQRRRLLIGGLAVTLALVAVAAVFSWRQYDDGKRHALNELDARAVLASTVFDTYFSGELAALRSIAAAPPVVEQRAAAMTAYFRRVHRTDKALFTGGLGWVDRSGELMASTTSSRSSSAINVADRGYFMAVMATRRPFISAGLVSRRGRRPVVVMAVPTYDASGRLSGVLAGSLALKQSRPSQRSLNLGYEGLVVIDRDGQELTSHGFVHPANELLLKRMRSRRSEVLANTRGLSGSGGRVVAYSTSPLPGWISVIDRSPSSVFASARRALLLELLSIIGAAVLLIALLVWVSRRVNRNALAERQRAEIAVELTRSLADAFTAQEVAEALATALAASFPESAAAVALTDGDGPSLEVAALVGRPAVPDANTAALRRLVTAALERGRPLRLTTSAAVTKEFTDLRPGWSRRVGSLYAVPIVSRDGRNLGAVVLTFTESRALDERDEAVVNAHLAQAIQALTRTLQQEREHEVAVELQRSLLPDELPRTDGVQFAARYHAGGFGVEVGGDWYDALRRPDGIIHVTVGDVAGRGIGSATLMAQLRNAFRAYALDSASPAEITRRLLRHIPDDGMVTTVCLTFDPYTRRLGYSLAGHPPPLLLDKRTRQVTQLADAAAPPLGFANPDSIKEHWQTALPETATIVAYTDGLVERRGASIDDGIERIAAVLRKTMGQSAEKLPDSLLDAASEGGAVDDDTALIVMDIGPTPSTLTVEIPGDASVMATLRRRLSTWLTLRGIDERQRIDAVLAIHEACINAIEHGYQSSSGTVQVRIEHADGALVMAIEDYGTWRPPTPGPSRGRGTQIMNQTMQTIEINHNGNGTRVVLEQRLAPETKESLGATGAPS
jgi:serine phosphatase RsbU (regulator of sigma subunit)/anti-sigma regulatory factor (Ser/Thr protein kinase)